MSESIAPVTVVEGANYPGSETIGPVTIVGDTVIGAGASVDSKDVQVLAGNVTGIDIVANNIDSVVTDANSIASINTVAAVSQQVVDVGNNITAVSAVAPKLNEVNRYYTTYLGASATPPTVRLDGTPLQSGDMYLSTALGSAGAYVRNLGAWYILSSANFVQQTQIDVKLSKSGDSMTGNIGMNFNKITSLGMPVDISDAVNKTYVDQAVGSKLEKAGGSMTGMLNMGGNKITGLTAPTSFDDATTKNYVDTGLGLKVSTSGGTMTGNLAMGDKKITGLGAPSANADATNKLYVDTNTLSKFGGTMYGFLAMDNNKITGLGAPTSSADAATKQYVDTKAATAITESGGTLFGSLSMNGNRLSGLPSPSFSDEATNKAYVDAAVATIIVQQNTNTNPPYGFTGSGSVVLQNSPQMLGTIAGVSQTLSGTLAVNGGITGGLTGNVTGNASTATTLATGRTIGMTGDVSYTSASFNGSSNVTGTATLANTAVVAGVYGSASAIPTITVDSKGRVTSASTNAPAAPSALATGRTIGMTGDVTYTSASFNGSANVTGTATLADTAVTPGTYGATYTGGTSANQIPIITVDAKGRVTSLYHNAIYRVPVANTADTAQALATGRTIGMTGDVTYTSASFDGSGNVTGTATLGTTTVTPGTYGSTSAIPSFTVDAKGRLTAASTSAITVPDASISAAKLTTTLANSLATTGKSIAMAVVFGG